MFRILRVQLGLEMISLRTSLRCFKLRVEKSLDSREGLSGSFPEMQV